MLKIYKKWVEKIVAKAEKVDLDYLQVVRLIIAEHLAKVPLKAEIELPLILKKLENNFFLIPLPPTK